MPDRVLATLGSTPELEAELLAAGLWKRVRKGIRFHDWERWNDTAEQAARKEEDAERKRAQNAERQRRHRAAKAGERNERITRAVTRASRVTADGVTLPDDTKTRKPQVNDTHVTRDSRVTSRVTPPGDTDRSRSDLSTVPKSRSRSKSARARGPEPGSPEFRSRVTAAFAEETGVTIGAEAVDVITADVLGGREDVGSQLVYVLTAVRNEPDPFGRWFPEPAAQSPAKAADPEWCGKCDQIDRTLENERRQLYDCPDCSPKTFAARKAIA